VFGLFGRHCTTLPSQDNKPTVCFDVKLVSLKTCASKPSHATIRELNQFFQADKFLLLAPSRWGKAHKEPNTSLLFSPCTGVLRQTITSINFSLCCHYASRWHPFLKTTRLYLMIAQLTLCIYMTLSLETTYHKLELYILFIWWEYF
jgi:hypothetical protein